MADRENVLTAISAEEEAEFGFTRTEMHKSNLAGTVDPYDRHIFVCFKGPDAWLPRVEESETDLLPKLFSSAVKARKNDITIKVLMISFSFPFAFFPFPLFMLMPLGVLTLYSLFLSIDEGNDMRGTRGD